MFIQKGAKGDWPRWEEKLVKWNKNKSFYLIPTLVSVKNKIPQSDCLVTDF